MTSLDSLLRTAYAECRKRARKHYENFPVASHLVPADKRDALAAIYAFARCADDFADEFTPGEAPAEREPRLALLADWRRKLNDCVAGNPADPVFIALADSIRKFNLSHAHFENLLCAFESDVRVDLHKDFASLLSYCTYSANPVGRLVIELFTPPGRREAVLFNLSDNICTALQLANFWQDVRIDLERGRVYLPLDDLHRFDLSLQDVDQLRTKCVPSAADRWAQFLSFEIARTRKLFTKGSTLPDLVTPELRLQLRFTWLGGMAILSKIESVGYDVFGHRPSLNLFDFLKLYFRARGKRALSDTEMNAHATATTQL
ncbi:MAG TPA: squalene synthase HpnC [Terriglobia bacterium]|nr:squalene synthase HpnC [Terriglobia bacterium]